MIKRAVSVFLVAVVLYISAVPAFAASPAPTSFADALSYDNTINGSFLEYIWYGANENTTFSGIVSRINGLISSPDACTGCTASDGCHDWSYTGGAFVSLLQQLVSVGGIFSPILYNTTCTTCGMSAYDYVMGAYNEALTVSNAAGTRYIKLYCSKDGFDYYRCYGSNLAYDVNTRPSASWFNSLGNHTFGVYNQLDLSVSSLDPLTCEFSLGDCNGYNEYAAFGFNYQAMNSVVCPVTGNWQACFQAYYNCKKTDDTYYQPKYLFTTAIQQFGMAVYSSGDIVCSGFNQSFSQGSNFSFLDKNIVGQLSWEGYQCSGNLTFIPMLRCSSVRTDVSKPSDVDNTYIDIDNNRYYDVNNNTWVTYNTYSYDYSSRTYNFTLDTGDTVTVNYGDEYITQTVINEGDTYNYYIYYVNPEPVVSPSPSPSPCVHDWVLTDTVVSDTYGWENVSAATSFTDYDGYIRYANHALNVAGSVSGSTANAFRSYSILPNTSYRVSLMMQSRFRIGAVPAVTNGAVVENYVISDEDTNGSDCVGALRSLEIISGASDNYLVVGCWSSGSGDTLQNTLDSLILEKSVITGIESYDLYVCSKCGAEYRDYTGEGAPVVEDDTTIIGWLSKIYDKLCDIFGSVEDIRLSQDTDNNTFIDDFMGKFVWVRSVYDIGQNFITDITADSELTYSSVPGARAAPVIYADFSEVTSPHGWNYGGEVELLDLSWYSEYKPTVDNLISGFLWLIFLWGVFKHAPGIVSGVGLVENKAPDVFDGARSKRF